MPAEGLHGDFTRRYLRSCLPVGRPSRARRLPEPIVVTAPGPEDDYAGSSAGVGPEERPLLDTPAAVTVVTRAVMDEQFARSIVGVVFSWP